MTVDKIPYIQHARRHLPGGTDPLPGTGRDINPFFEITPFALQMLSDSGFSTWVIDGFSWMSDSTVPTGGYMVGTAVDDHMTFGVPLGPRGSIWHVQVGTYRNSDGGNVQIEFATSPVDEMTGFDFGSGPVGTAKSIRHYSDTNYPGTPNAFYNAANALDTDTFSCYGAGPGWDWQDGLSTFIIDGADGQMLSANGDIQANSSWPSNYFDPGIAPRFLKGGGDPSVMWWMRLRIKSAGTEAGTKARIGWVRISRRSGNGEWIV